MNSVMASIEDLAALEINGFERSIVYDSNGEPHTVSFKNEGGLRINMTARFNPPGGCFIATVLQEERPKKPKRYRITGVVAGISIPPVVAPTIADANRLIDEYRSRVRKPEDCNLTTEEID